VAVPECWRYRAIQLLTRAAAARAGGAQRIGTAAAPRGQQRSESRTLPGISSACSPEAGERVRRNDDALAPERRIVCSSPRASDLGRQLLRLEQRTIEILNDPNTDQQAVERKLAWLEANVAELRRAEDASKVWRRRFLHLLQPVLPPLHRRPCRRQRRQEVLPQRLGHRSRLLPDARARDPVCRSRRFGGGAGACCSVVPLCQKFFRAAQCFVDRRSKASPTSNQRSAKGRLSRTDRTAGERLLPAAATPATPHTSATGSADTRRSPVVAASLVDCARAIRTGRDHAFFRPRQRCGENS
jgi:hypothetical protein